MSPVIARPTFPFRPSRLVQYLVMVAWLTGLALGGSQAAEKGVPAEESKTGLATGSKAPGFELQAHDGRTYSLAGLLENGPVALVFYRSADW